MKTRRMTFADYTSFKPENPERAAFRSLGAFGETVEVKWWPSRSGLRVTVDAQGKRAPRAGDWHPFVKFP